MNRKILRLAIPNIISNLSVPLLSSADTIVMGHLDKVYYLGAIAVGSVIFNFIYLGLNFLRMGTTGLTAQSFGRGIKKDTGMILVRAVSAALILAAVLILSKELIAWVSFAVMGATPEVELYAREYFDIRIFAAPATLALYAFHGWFLGMQNAKYPLILAVAGNLLNLGLNLFFVLVFDMKSDGIAWGTVIAQYTGLGLAVYLFMKRYREYLPDINLAGIFQIEPFKKFFSLNFDIFIRTLVVIFAFNYFTAESATFGNKTLAANTILLQLWMLLSYGVDGFAFAAESLTGRYIGEGDETKLKKVIRYIFVWGMGLGVIFSAVYYFFDNTILSLFTDNQEVITIALVYFGWTAAAPLVNSWCFIWDGIYVGAMETKTMRNTMIISMLAFYLPLYFLTRDYIGNHALWLALTGFMAARGLLLTAYAKKTVVSAAGSP